MKNDEEKFHRVISALKSDESLLDCFLEMIDTIEDEEKQLKTGDDAEEAVVDVIQKTGAILLQKWAHQKNEEAKSLALKNQDIRPQGKKKSAGIHLLET